MTTQQEARASFWWMSLVRGILLIVFGLMMLSWPGRSLLVLIQVMGAYWLVGGVFDLVEGIVGRPERSRLWMILGGVLSMIAGFLVMGHPVISGLMASTFLVYFMGIAALAVGITQILAGREGKRSLGSLILGILTVIFGVIVLLNPLVTQAVIILVLPFWALTAGVLGIVTSLILRGRPVDNSG